MKLELPNEDAAFEKSLLAVVRVGDDLWTGGDEGNRALCLRRTRGDTEKSTFTKVSDGEINLVEELDLPGQSMNGEGELPEVDLEGMD